MQTLQETIMPLTVIIPDALLKKLQSVAIPLVDTPLTVIERGVDALIKVGGANVVPSAGISVPNVSAMPYPADAPPSLTFTRPISISLNGKPVEKEELYWNLFLFKVVAAAATKLKGPQLQQALLVNFVAGKHEVSGYRFIPEAALSVQGADANAAWKATIHLIKATHMKVDVTFRWDSKEGAANPGQVGRMTYNPA